jgi:pyruvate dehydrogenase E1 component beta subunit
MPLSENAITGVCIGASLSGMRPILTHMRIDFALLSMDQIINNAAMWHFMYGGQTSVPLVIRAIVGRGWGQGPQHSQNLHALFSHIPGLKVVTPARPYDAKGLLLAAIEDNNPIIFIEHRWLHTITGPVPAGYYTVPIGKANIVNKGKDVTVVASSYMTIESIKALEIIKSLGISVDLIDLRSTKPLDTNAICMSVRKTGRIVVVDSAWRTLGLASEILAVISESDIALRTPPVRLTLPDAPAPTSFSLAQKYYPSVVDIARAIMNSINIPHAKQDDLINAYLSLPHPPSDVPDMTFRGPF